MKTITLLKSLVLCSCTTITEASSPMKKKGYVAIPLKYNPMGHYEVIARINVRKAKLILDIGDKKLPLNTREMVSTFKLKKSGT